MKIIAENTYYCDECGETKGPLIELNDNGDGKIFICLECLQKAIELASPSVSTPPMHLEAFDGLFDAHD
jgi:hypothetical protein